MSGLSTLLAYEDEDEDDDGKQPLQSLDAAAHDEQQLRPSAASSESPPTSPTSSSQKEAKSTGQALAEREQQQTAAPHTPPQVQRTDAASVAAMQSRVSTVLITPQLSRLIAQLPPIPAAVLPRRDVVHAYFSSLPPHFHSLLHKRHATQSSSLIAQLTALPAFHNPAILQRILDTQRINQHDTLWPRDTEEGEAEEDSVEGMRRQAEREQKQREQTEVEEQREREAKAADEQERGRQQQPQSETGRTNSTSTVQDTLSWRDRELRKRGVTAMHSVKPPLEPAPSNYSAVPLVDAAAASADSKRQEAMRRAAEISKRLRQT